MRANLQRRRPRVRDEAHGANPRKVRARPEKEAVRKPRRGARLLVNGRAATTQRIDEGVAGRWIHAGAGESGVEPASSDAQPAANAVDVMWTFRARDLDRVLTCVAPRFPCVLFKRKATCRARTLTRGRLCRAALSRKCARDLVCCRSVNGRLARPRIRRLLVERAAEAALPVLPWLCVHLR